MIEKSLKIYWSIWTIVLLYIFLLWIEILPYPSELVLTFLTIFDFLFISFFFYLHTSFKCFSISHVHFIYAAMGAFSVGWVYYIVGSSSVVYGSDSTARFIDSSYWVSRFYSPSIVLSMLAFHFYPIGCLLGCYSNRHDHINYRKNTRTEKAIGNLGLFLLVISAASFLYLMYIGVFYIGMVYEKYRLLLDMFPFLSLIVLFYSIGICSVVACGNKNQLKIGWALFLLTAFFYFSTGNKGEVLYALLSVIGIMVYKGLKMDWRLIGAIAVLAFVVIPFITASRHSGVISGNIGMTFSPTALFVEIGTQIRCTVYMLDDFYNNTRDYIYGYSYYSPILNILDHIIPGLRMEVPPSFDFKDSFATMGFNQIAEGYANFGAFGGVLYFLAVGFYLGRNESKKLSPVRLGLVGSICSEFINVSRNKFAFFWGHVLIIYMLYIIIIFITNRKLK